MFTAADVEDVPHVSMHSVIRPSCNFMEAAQTQKEENISIIQKKWSFVIVSIFQSPDFTFLFMLTEWFSYMSRENRALCKQQALTRSPRRHDYMTWCRSENGPDVLPHFLSPLSANITRLIVPFKCQHHWDLGGRKAFFSESSNVDVFISHNWSKSKQDCGICSMCRAGNCSFKQPKRAAQTQCCVLDIHAYIFERLSQMFSEAPFRKHPHTVCNNSHFPVLSSFGLFWQFST